MASDSAAEAGLPRSVWLIALGAIVLSTALHVVPQLLRESVDPAWSMLVLMTLDACVVALIVRSRSALLVGILLAALLGAAVLSHQQLLAALPSIALNLMLASVFAVTLRRGETPLIVRIAELDSAALTPQFRRYLHGVDAGVGDIFCRDGGFVAASDAVRAVRLVVAVHQRAELAADRSDVHRRMASAGRLL